MIRIAPSLLAADFSRLAEQVSEAEAGGADWLHLDVMDGRFVPNISFGPPVLQSLRTHTRLPFDVHLMIVEPDRYLAAFREAGADLITVHQEACPHLHRTIGAIHELGAKAGVALNPATPVSTLGSVIEDLDLVLIMSVNPGFGGQRFIPQTLDKLREVRELAGKRAIHVEVDGGIGEANIGSCVAAGADVLVAGTTVFRRPDITAAIAELRKAARGNHQA